MRIYSTAESLTQKMHAYLGTLYTRLGHKIKSNEWGQGEWQMKLTVNDKHKMYKARVKNQENQSR